MAVQRTHGEKNNESKSSYEDSYVVFSQEKIDHLCLEGMAIENWQKMEGADKRYLVPKPEDCQKKCISNPDCCSWTFKKRARGNNGVAGTASNCLNKANQPFNKKSTTPNSDFVSGSKHCTFADFLEI